MSSLAEALSGFTSGLSLGSAEQRSAIREVVERTCAQQGYTAKVASFNGGTLILHARPAEAYMLRMDVNVLRQAFADAGVGNLVENVKVICRV